MLNALLPALFLGSAAIAGQPASAELSYTQAELTTESGSQAVYQRVVSVAETVCEAENRHTVMSASATRTCVADTVDRALSQISAPRLNEIHASRSISPDGRGRVVLAASRD
jgi:UrcA family protein